LRCTAITRGGSRCKLEATHSSYCYQHSPETADERRRNARRGGKAGGNGRASGLAETAQARRYIKGLVSQLLAGQVQRDVATAAFQGLNVLARYVELERRIHEQDELEVRLEALEQRARVEQSTWQSRRRR
jgi:hypothetical protein